MNAYTQNYIFHTHINYTDSIYWEKYYNVGSGGFGGPNLFPTSLPRIVDPANPANNLYETGIGTFKERHRRDEGWQALVANIHTVDLCQSV